MARGVGPAKRSGLRPRGNRRLVHGQDWRLGGQPHLKDDSKFSGQDAVPTVQQVRRGVDVDDDADAVGDDDDVNRPVDEEFVSVINSRKKNYYSPSTIWICLWSLICIWTNYLFVSKLLNDTDVCRFNRKSFFNCVCYLCIEFSWFMEPLLLSIRWLNKDVLCLNILLAFESELRLLGRGFSTAVGCTSLANEVMVRILLDEGYKQWIKLYREHWKEEVVASVWLMLVEQA